MFLILSLLLSVPASNFIAHRIICEAKTGQIKPPTKKLLELLDKYFLEDGPLEDCPFESLHEMASLVYTRYMCAEAHDAAVSYIEHAPDVYGVPVTLPDASAPSARGPRDSLGAPALTAPPEKRNILHGDEFLATTVNFMRITFWYLEMCAATAEGDIGRVFEIIKV